MKEDGIIKEKPFIACGQWGRIAMPFRYLTIEDIEETGESDPDFIQWLRDNQNPRP